MTASIHGRHFGVDTPGRPDVVIALSLAAFTLLLLYLLRPMEMSGNSVWFINSVQDWSWSDPPFYPPHLLHLPIISLIYSFLSNISSCNVACAGMTQSMIWAAITIASTYIIARIVLGTALGAIAAAFMVLVSHGFWVYATQLEVYVPVVGCLTAATALLFTNRSDQINKTRVIAVSALWALAALYHLASVVFFVPLCVFFYDTQGWRGWRQLVTVSALAGGIVLATFVVAYWWGGDVRVGHKVVGDGLWSIGAFLSWVLEITDRPMTDWGSLSNWQPAELFRAGWSQIQAVTLLPDYLTIGQTPPLDQLPLVIVGALIVVAALLWNAIQVLRHAPPAGARLYFLLLFSANFLFFAWWQPSTHKFYIPSSIPLIMLMALTLRDMHVRSQGASARRIIGSAAAACIALVFVFNLSSILELRKSRGPAYAEAEIFNRLVPENCRLYAHAPHLAPLRIYFGRRNNVGIIDLEADFYFAMTDRSIQNSRYLEATTVQSFRSA